MTLDEVRLARKLLGRLVFQTMPTVLGQRFQVDRVEDFENSADLLPLVDLEGELKTQPRSITGTLMKYGFVDLRFSLTHHPTTSHQQARESSLACSAKEALIAQENIRAIVVTASSTSRLCANRSTLAHSS
ncbi:MAG: hypothetical protein ACI9KE_002158 [Polyangiales bacterium]|jgi:hypothetical protein